jgi:hypothetical protein
MPRISRIVLTALVSLGVILGIYTTAHGVSLDARQGSMGSHPVNIYSRSFNNSSSEALKIIQDSANQGERGNGCHSDHMQTDPEG